MYPVPVYSLCIPSRKICYASGLNPISLRFPRSCCSSSNRKKIAIIPSDQTSTTVLSWYFFGGIMVDTEGMVRFAVKKINIETWEFNHASRDSIKLVDMRIK